jgi:hypothetical protein
MPSVGWPYLSSISLLISSDDTRSNLIDLFGFQYRVDSGKWCGIKSDNNAGWQEISCWQCRDKESPDKVQGSGDTNAELHPARS